jgi:hypothetical protein
MRIAGVVVVVAVIATFAGCGGSGGTGSSGNALDRLEATLASQLNDLEGRCRESRPQLATLLWSTNQVLKQDGYPESLTITADAVVTAVPASLTGFDCRGAMAAYLVVREQG